MSRKRSSAQISDIEPGEIIEDHPRRKSRRPSRGQLQRQVDRLTKQLAVAKKLDEWTEWTGRTLRDLCEQAQAGKIALNQVGELLRHRMHMRRTLLDDFSQ